MLRDAVPRRTPGNGAPPAGGKAQARPLRAGAVLGLPARRTAGKNGNGKDFDAAEFLAHAGLSKVIVEVAKGATVFSQGDTADSVFYVQKGRVKVSVVSKQGREAVVALMGAGDFLGELCIAAGHPTRLTTARALADTVLLKIGRKEMARVLREEHALSEVFVTFLLARNAHIQADLIDQLFNSSEKRLARTLLLLAQFGKEGKPEIVIPKLSQETLAEMVGTTRSRVSFFMNRFRKMGFIDYTNGDMQVHSSLLNVVLHD
jgi:CRP/FNR family transcriptional regulator, cyclic AMP receptor protein